MALLSYILSLEIGACEKRRYNNFFAGLFHDLPEVLTRDIISPVKNSIEGLSELIKAIEEEQMEQMLLPLLPGEWRHEMRYFTDDEFSCRIILDGRTIKVSTEKINELYNFDRFSPVDGSIIEFCDKFAAYMEAYLSIKHGITSKHLIDGHSDVYRRFARKKIAGIDVGVIFDYFRLE